MKTNGKNLILQDSLFQPFGGEMLQNRINRIFNNLVKYESPMVNVVEENGQYKMLFVVPGIRAEDINIQIEKNILTISGETSQEWTKDCTHQEWTQTSFKRSLTLPQKVTTSDPEAVMKDGVLMLTWDIAEPPHVKRIPVTTG